MVLGPVDILNDLGLREVRQPLNFSGGQWRGKLSCDDPLANDESRRRAAWSLQSVPSYSLSVIIGHILSAANLATELSREVQSHSIAPFNSLDSRVRDF